MAPERVARLRAPAGLDIGAITPEEIALAILADIVRERRWNARDAAGEGDGRRDEAAIEAAPREPAEL